jgi:cation transport ATPase
MTFMIVASPCAVVLATMPPLLSAIANAGRHGVLAKSAVVMEKLGTATHVAFDKTGALTEGTLPLPLGVAGHEGSTVIVGLNGLRLLRESAWRRANAALPVRRQR